MANYIDEIYIDGNGYGVSFNLLCCGDTIVRLDYDLDRIADDLINEDWEDVAAVLDENMVLFVADKGIRVDYGRDVENASDRLDDGTVIYLFNEGIRNTRYADLEDYANKIDYELNRAIM